MGILKFGDHKSLLQVDGDNGIFLSFSYDGEELLRPMPDAFELRLFEHSTGTFLSLVSSQFEQFACAANRLSWSNCSRFPNLRVECSLSFADCIFRFRPSVLNIPDAYWLDFIEIPRLAVPIEHDYFWPHGAGLLVRMPFLDGQKENRCDHHVTFPGTADLTFYPGTATFQYLASIGNKSGIYLGADDKKHTPKLIEIGNEVSEEKKLHMRFEQTCGEAGMSQNFTLPYDIVLQGFTGDWRDAAEIQRAAFVNDPVLKPRYERPKWLDEHPIAVIAAVCGNEKISDRPNGFLPYPNTLKMVRQLAAKLHSKILVLLMRWDHNGPWLPPYQWPPVGGEENFRKFVDELHSEGHYVGLYGSGTMFTIQSHVNPYNIEDEFEKEGLLKYMARGPQGEYLTKNCASLRKGTEMCMTEPWCQETILEQVRKVAEAKVDVYQLLDQMHGGVPFACYCKEHQHPAMPGQWMTDNMQELLAKCREIAALAGHPMLIACENHAALPFLSEMPFNDYRNPEVYGETVDAAAYLTHEYSNNFGGNYSWNWGTYQNDKCPENLQMQIAQNVVRGDYLSIPLLDNGSIPWSMCAPWDGAIPEQDPLFKLLRDGNNLRKLYPEFLKRGRMCKPIAKIQCGIYTAPMKRRDKRDYPSIASNAFLDLQTAKKMQFMANFLKIEQSVTLVPIEKCVLEIEGKRIVLEEATTLNVPGLSYFTLQTKQESLP